MSKKVESSKSLEEFNDQRMFDSVPLSLVLAVVAPLLLLTMGMLAVGWSWLRNGLFFPLLIWSIFLFTPYLVAGSFCRTHAARRRQRLGFTFLIIAGAAGIPIYLGVLLLLALFGAGSAL